MNQTAQSNDYNVIISHIGKDPKSFERIVKQKEVSDLFDVELSRERLVSLRNLVDRMESLYISAMNSLQIDPNQAIPPDIDSQKVERVAAYCPHLRVWNFANVLFHANMDAHAKIAHLSPSSKDRARSPLNRNPLPPPPVPPSQTTSHSSDANSHLFSVFSAVPSPVPVAAPADQGGTQQGQAQNGNVVVPLPLRTSSAPVGSSDPFIVTVSTGARNHSVPGSSTGNINSPSVLASSNAKLPVADSSNGNPSVQDSSSDPSTHKPSNSEQVPAETQIVLHEGFPSGHGDEPSASPAANGSSSSKVKQSSSKRAAPDALVNQTAKAAKVRSSRVAAAPSSSSSPASDASSPVSSPIQKTAPLKIRLTRSRTRTTSAKRVPSSFESPVGTSSLENSDDERPVYDPRRAAKIPPATTGTELAAPSSSTSLAQTEPDYKVAYFSAPVCLYEMQRLRSELETEVTKAEKTLKRVQPYKRMDTLQEAQQRTARDTESLTSRVDQLEAMVNKLSNQIVKDREDFSSQLAEKTTVIESLEQKLAEKQNIVGLLKDRFESSQSILDNPEVLGTLYRIALDSLLKTAPDKRRSADIKFMLTLNYKLRKYKITPS